MFRMSEAANMVVEEAFLVSSCINELGLIQLDRDDSMIMQPATPNLILGLNQIRLAS